PVKRLRTCGHDEAGPAGVASGDAGTRRWSHEDRPPPNRCHEQERTGPGATRKNPITAPGRVQQLQSVILADVTSAVGTSGTAITSRVHSLNRPNMVSVGTIVWLSSELMLFAGLFAMYFTARAHAGGKWPPPPSA